VRGFREALEERGIAAKTAPVFSVGVGPEALAAWLQQTVTVRSETSPTAVVAYDDRQALALVKAAQAQGLEIPGDLSVVGFDNIPMASLWEPPLTTIRMPMQEMGSLAFRRLLERIERPDVPPMKMMLPVELVVRGSTAPPR
jgi:LacI family transcriptional regulator